MTWTVHEQKRIAAMEDRLTEVDKHVSDIRRALMEPSPTGEPPLLKRASDAVVMLERSGWVGKMLVRGLLLMGSIAGAIIGIGALIKVWING